MSRNSAEVVAYTIMVVVFCVVGTIVVDFMG